MKVLITGIAGFIGSTLAEECSRLGWDVAGCDNLSDYYEAAQKRYNLKRIEHLPGISFAEISLSKYLGSVGLTDIDVVFHQAGQPGVRGSWERGFNTYVDANIIATQELLEACRQHAVKKIVLASSSSVYGNASEYPVTEETATRPYSPYGVTKLAAERLALAYADNFGLDIAALRYFTVYGPGQRPDMAMHRLIRSALTGSDFPLFGSGEQIRDFTYVRDAVSANIKAATTDVSGGHVYNVCGGSAVSLSDVIAIIQDIVGAEAVIDRRPPSPGDVARTGGSSERIRAALGWTAETSIENGLRDQVDWMRGWLRHSQALT